MGNPGSNGQESEMFAGQVGLVTGAGSGIGRAVALALAERGMRVGCADINAAVAEETAENLDGALAITMDVRDQDSWEAAVEATITRFDRLHGKAVHHTQHAAPAIGHDAVFV